MPELPEVETVLRGLSPHVVGRRILGMKVREPRLRWPVPGDLEQQVRGCVIQGVTRRGKYLLFELLRGTHCGYLIVHLGMSGSLRLCPSETSPQRHDHVDVLLQGGQCLRLRDPRRFGTILWTKTPEAHPLLAKLGKEPLSPDFNGQFLHALCRHRKTAIKPLLMNARLIVGIGNIYVNEALFRAGIDPRLAAGRLSLARCERLAAATQDTLSRAIAAGGSSLRDFVDGHGQPGYFQQSYFVYGRAGEPCRVCGTPIRRAVQGARSTFFCPNCQKR
jgi:formamidopyrimidine-DNA glycosylase